MASEDVRVVTAVAGRAMYSTNEVDPTIPVTHQAFTTVRSIRGAVPESFVVEFTGGPTEEGGTKYVLELEGQPQFEQGKTYFLVLMGPKPTGEFFVFGGAQGRYELNGKELTPAKGADPGDAVVSALAGRDVEHAAALLRGQ